MVRLLLANLWPRHAERSDQFKPFAWWSCLKSQSTLILWPDTLKKDKGTIWEEISSRIDNTIPNATQLPAETRKDNMSQGSRKLKKKSVCSYNNKKGIQPESWYCVFLMIKPLQIWTTQGSEWSREQKRVICHQLILSCDEKCVGKQGESFLLHFWKMGQAWNRKFAYIKFARVTTKPQTCTKSLGELSFFTGIALWMRKQLVLSTQPHLLYCMLILTFIIIFSVA